MNTLQSAQVQVLLAPTTQTVATNSTSYGYLDSVGSDGVKWDTAKIVAIFGAFATTSQCAKLLTITEGSAATAADAIVPLTCATSTSTSAPILIPPYMGATEGTAVVFDLDLRRRKRYLRVNLAPGNPDIPVVVALLSHGKQEPSADRGSATLEVVD
jgi:hypothetical protein